MVCVEPMEYGAKSIGAGAATIASGGAAGGIGKVFSALLIAVARNPAQAKQSFGYAILGFALTEAIASFASMMAFLLSSVFQCSRLLATSNQIHPHINHQPTNHLLL